MKNNQSLPSGSRGCLTEIAITLVSICVILLVSLNYRNYGDDYACRGGLGAGFPVSFVCDHVTGGSPISSWGRIDWADFPYFSLRGLLTDMLFYSAILWTGWILRRLFQPADSYAVATYVWIGLICVAFIFGFLSAAAIFRADRINFHDYVLGIPTPAPATPTPFGTLSPALTSVPTAESAWKTFSNQEMAYEFKYPREAEVEVLDKSTGKIRVNAGSGGSFMVTAIRDYSTADVLYYLDTAASGERRIGEYVWSEYVLPDGYCDAVGCTPPLYALQMEAGGVLYAVTFHSQDALTERQIQILATFRVTGTP